MLSVRYDSTVLEVHTMLAHPFFCLLDLPTVTPLVPLLDDACFLCSIAECTKGVTLFLV